MEEQDLDINYQQIIERLRFFYPAEWFTDETVESDILNGNLVYKPVDYLPYLQTALLDEKFIEVRYDDNELPHFTKIIDWPEDSDIEGESSGDANSNSPPTPAAYFSSLSHITTLPLEPGIGNYHIRNSEKVVMRFFTKSYAVELCTTFLSTDKDNDIPVLHFHFPVLCRLLHGAREYRAKVIEDLNLRVRVTGKRKQPDIINKALNISVSGMAFSLSKQDVQHLFIDEIRKLTLLHDDKPLLTINTNVRHVTRIRKPTSIAYMCGVEFDIITRELQSEIESLVAMAQRVHLQALSGMAQKTGYKLIT